MCEEVKLYTWDELFGLAIDKPYRSKELKAKDNARYELERIILEKTGVDINCCEVPEDAIEEFLEADTNTYVFDEDGYLLNMVKCLQVNV